MTQFKNWTKSDDAALKAAISNNCSVKEAAKKLHRTETAVIQRARKLRNTYHLAEFSFSDRNRAKKTKTVKAKPTTTRNTHTVETTKYVISAPVQKPTSMLSVDVAACALTVASIAVVLSLVL